MKHFLSTLVKCLPSHHKLIFFTIEIFYMVPSTYGIVYLMNFVTPVMEQKLDWVHQ